jgi:hypothetical protein
LGANERGSSRSAPRGLAVKSRNYSNDVNRNSNCYNICPNHVGFRRPVGLAC